MNTVLIFGISGFVGPYLAAEFHLHGYKVFGADLLPSSSIPEYVDFFKCNILSIEEVLRVVQETAPSHIVNLAAISSVGLSWDMPQKTIAVNVEGTINILESIKKTEHPPKVLLIGSSEEYIITDKPIDEETELNANNPYGISKVMQENFSAIYRKRYGMNIYHVRAFNHTGIGQSDTFVIPSWCKQAAEIAKSNKPGIIKVGNIDVMRDFSHVKDVVRAYRMVLESDDCTQVYNIGSGKALSLKEILSYIVSLSKKPISIEIDEKLFRPADNPIICADNSKIKSLLNWKVESSIFNAASEMFNYYYYSF